MNTGMARTPWVFGVVLAAALGSAAHADQIFDRSADWLPGVPGQTSGSPGPGGPATWIYEYTSGGGSLADPTPWYSTPSTAMTWDAAWWQSGRGVWSTGDEVSPPIDENRMAHNLAAGANSNVPVIRFRNPLGVTALFDVAGELSVIWDGVNGVGRPTLVDVVIGKQNAAMTSTSILFSDTFDKPNNFASIGDRVDVGINLPDIELAPGESIIVSHRGRVPVAPGGWIHLQDNMTITTIPTPGAFTLMALGGLVAVRRRR